MTSSTPSSVCRRRWRRKTSRISARSLSTTHPKHHSRSEQYVCKQNPESPGICLSLYVEWPHIELFIGKAKWVHRGLARRSVFQWDHITQKNCTLSVCIFSHSGNMFQSLQDYQSVLFESKTQGDVSGLVSQALCLPVSMQELLSANQSNVTFIWSWLKILPSWIWCTHDIRILNMS